MISVKKFIKEHKIITVIILVLLLCGLGAGGYYGYGVYKYRQTSAFAVERLKSSLTPPDAGSLAKMIDFRSVSRDLAQAIMKSFPFYLAGQDQERKIGDVLQGAILKQIGEKASVANITEGEAEEKALQKPLILLPADFAEQFVKNLTLRDTGEDSALLSTSIKNPQLKQPVNILLRMRKTADGWTVRNVVNSIEISEQIKGELLARHNRLREVFEKKNAATRKKMDQVLPMLACNADAGVLSDGKTLILMLRVLARNKGQVQTNNYSVEVSIYGKNDKLIERRFLNTAKPVAPGEDFDHRWSYEMDSQSPLAQEFMANVPLHCTATWQTLGLNNFQVWHIEDVPNPDRACLLDGHDHPEGFCVTPIFLP